MASKRQVFVGGVPIGGGAPVVVQTMAKTETANLGATMDQIRTVADATRTWSAWRCHGTRSEPGSPPGWSQRDMV